MATVKFDIDRFRMEYAKQMRHWNHTVKMKNYIAVFHKCGWLEFIHFGKRSKRNRGKGLI